MTQKVKAYSGNLEIIGNGTAHVNSEQPLLLVIGGNLEMEFEFLSDSKDSEFRTSYRVEEGKWIWELTNYNNSLGSGIISPLQVGTLEERKLFVSFFVWTPNEKEGRRIVNYVVYQEKEG
jgi:hypothetical protein